MAIAGFFFNDGKNVHSSLAISTTDKGGSELRTK